MMKTMSILKNVILSVLVAALTLTALPFTNVYAMGNSDPTPPPQKGQISNARLEEVWARQLDLYNRFGQLFDGGDAIITKVQSLIDKAKANGKDVSAVQAALDAFVAARKAASPTYESLKGIVNSHQGFDSAGKVTDAVKAKATLQDMGTKLRDIRDQLGGTAKALKDAMRNFRAANKPFGSA
jgi:hypothetical protein